METREILTGIGIFACAFTILVLLRGLIISTINKRCLKKPAELILSVVRVPSYLWSLCFALLITVSLSPAPERFKGPINKCIEVTLLISVMIALHRLAVTMVIHGLEKTGSRIAHSGLIRALIGSFVYGIGLLLILSQLGVQIGPLLTALGVGGLAAALALKDTLENLFSGIQLLIDRSIEVGDLVKLEVGHEGIIIDIGWRNSKLCLPQKEVVVIPNSKLAQSVTIVKQKNAISKGEAHATLQQTG